MVLKSLNGWWKEWQQQETQSKSCVALQGRLSSGANPTLSVPLFLVSDQTVFISFQPWCHPQGVSRHKGVNLRTGHWQQVPPPFLLSAFPWKELILFKWEGRLKWAGILMWTMLCDCWKWLVYMGNTDPTVNAYPEAYSRGLQPRLSLICGWVSSTHCKFTLAQWKWIKSLFYPSATNLLFEKNNATRVWFFCC